MFLALFPKKQRPRAAACFRSLLRLSESGVGCDVLAHVVAAAQHVCDRARVVVRPLFMIGVGGDDAKDY